VVIRFEDTGAGVASPELLFKPFQRGADATGVGLYVSRAILRNCGGDSCSNLESRGAASPYRWPEQHARARHNMAKASSKAIRLLVIDDHALFRESIARLLQAEGFEVIASCGSCADARKAVESWTDIDVVLLDFDLGSEKAADFIDFLGASRFPGKILLVTAGVNDNEAFTLMRQGISGIFLKHGFPSSLTQGIRDAIDGKVLFDQEML
jgi:CheY-like chemotaxis protein